MSKRKQDDPCEIVTVRELLQPTNYFCILSTDYLPHSTIVTHELIARSERYAVSIVSTKITSIDLAFMKRDFSSINVAASLATIFDFV